MKHFRRLLILLVLTVLTMYGLARLGDFDLNTVTLARIRWTWVGVALFIFYSTILVRGLRWRHILKTIGWTTSFGYALTLLIAGLFFSSILPARLGDVGRVAMLKQDHQIPVSQGLASIAAERALDVFAILALATISALWVLQGRVPAEVLQLMVAVTLLFVLGLIALLTIPVFEAWLRNPSPRLQEKLGLLPPVTAKAAGRRHTLWRLYHKALDFGFSLIHGVRTLGQNPVALTVIIFESFYIWLGDGLLIYFSLLSIEANPSLGLSVFGMLVSNLTIAVPITPGGIGQFEGILLGILTLFDVKTADGTLGILMMRIISLWLFIPISGLITYIFGFARIFNLKADVLKPSDTTPITASAPPAPLEG